MNKFLSLNGFASVGCIVAAVGIFMLMCAIFYLNWGCIEANPSEWYYCHVPVTEADARAYALYPTLLVLVGLGTLILSGLLKIVLYLWRFFHSPTRFVGENVEIIVVLPKDIDD